MTEKGQTGMEGMLPSQVIVVTGGGQGIGKAVALGAAAEGAAVAVVDLHAEAAQAVAPNP